jgi:DNA (cytosine-5)-methyltransferase 1
MSFDFIDLFAGIGGMRLAFQDAGGTCVFSSEWDKDSQKTYEANFGEVPVGDITEISVEEIPNFDVLLARNSLLRCPTDNQCKKASCFLA